MIFNAISAASGGGGAKIATGSYVGTGTYGSSNPCSLTFDFEPRYLIIQTIVYDSSDDKNITYALIPVEQLKAQNVITFWETRIIYQSGGTSGTYTNLLSNRFSVTADGKTFSWYGTNYIYQINEKGYTYSYLAIG